MSEPEEPVAYTSAIHAFMVDRGLVTRDMAEMLGVQEATISAWLAGTEKPQREDYDRLLDLGVALVALPSSRRRRSPPMTCSGCGIALTPENRSSSRSRCKPCESRRVSEWQRKNPEKNRQKSRRWQQNHPKYHREAVQRYRERKRSLDPGDADATKSSPRRKESSSNRQDDWRSAGKAAIREGIVSYLVHHGGLEMDQDGVIRCAREYLSELGSVSQDEMLVAVDAVLEFLASSRPRTEIDIKEQSA